MICATFLIRSYLQKKQPGIFKGRKIGLIHIAEIEDGDVRRIVKIWYMIMASVSLLMIIQVIIQLV